MTGCKNCGSLDLYPTRRVCWECRRAEKRTPHARARANELKRKQYAESAEKPEAMRWAEGKSRYGVTRERYEALLDEQGGRCAICRTDSPGAKAWKIDHDHACCPGNTSCGSCVRGLLCNRCNVGIGMLGDNPEVLFSAAEYLLAGLTGSGQPNMQANIVKRQPV